MKKTHKTRMNIFPLTVGVSALLPILAGCPQPCVAPPRADAGLDQTVKEGDAVQLVGVNSADPNGGPLTFQWTQLPGGVPVSISGVFMEESSFDAPEVAGPDINLEFELTVTNAQGCFDSDIVVITVTDDPPCTNVVCPDDGAFCNGTEFCDDGECHSSGNPCPATAVCDEDTDSCPTFECTMDVDCDDGVACTIDTCMSGICEYDENCVDQPCNASNGECGDTIDSSQTITGTIDSLIDRDFYFFDGEAGQRLFLQISRTSGDLTPRIDLFAPDGGPREAAVGNSTDAATILFAHPLAESGAYTVMISDHESVAGGVADDTGGYNLSMMLLPGACTSMQDPDGCSIAFGETKSGNIDPEVDWDAYNFDGQAGQRVIIQVSRTSGSLNPVMHLFPPDGGPREAVVGNEVAPDALLNAHQLVETGEYTIIIADHGSGVADDTGGYDLTLTLVP